MRLKIKRWDALAHLKKKPCSLILLIGKRGTGKSFLLQYLSTIYAQTGLIDLVIGFSPTDESNEVLRSFIPRTLIYNTFDEGLFERVLFEQRKRIRQGKPRRNVLFVLDDCGFDAKAIFKSKTLKDLFYNGRHAHVTVVMTLQYVLDMPIEFRTNIDVAICLREQIQVNRERLWKYFYGIMPTQKAFNMAMDACTTRYGALVTANNLTLSNEITDSIFWIRAPAKFDTVRLGHPSIWALDERCFHDREFEVGTTVEVRNVTTTEEED